MVSRAAVEALLGLAHHGARLAFISGRSTAWFENNIQPLIPEADVAGIFFAAEMGALTRIGAGEWTLHVTQSIDPGFRSVLRGTFEASGLRRHLEWDETKLVGLTVESRHTKSIEETSAALSTWMDIVASQVTERGYDCQRSVYAVDIVMAGQSKAFGARLALDHHGADGRSQIVVFGDSLSDAAMAQAAQEHGAGRVLFAWLGEGRAPTVAGVTVESAPQRFWAGTMALLSAIENRWGQ
jgi:hypothetical protein